MRISDWSSDVCSSDLAAAAGGAGNTGARRCAHAQGHARRGAVDPIFPFAGQSLHLPGCRDPRHLPDWPARGAGCGPGPLSGCDYRALRSEEHTSELQSLMRISYAVFCLTKKNNHTTQLTMYVTHS